MEARSLETTPVRSDKASGTVERLKTLPRRAKNYIEELQAEMRRVTWPSWKQVRATTGVVIAAVFAFAAYFTLVDILVGGAIQSIFQTLSKR